MTPVLLLPSTYTNQSTVSLHEYLFEHWKTNHDFWGTIAMPHADIYSVSDSTKTPTIKQIRAFLNELQYQPHQLQKKLFIIWRLDEASVPAQNALLKSLEEPPEYAQIVATVQTISNVLPTIQSRTNQVCISQNKKDTAPSNIEYSQFCNISFWHNTSYGDLFVLANQHKDREEALHFLEQLLHTIKQHSSYPNTFLVAMLQKVQETYFQVQANGNLQLTIGESYIQIKNSLAAAT